MPQASGKYYVDTFLGNVFIGTTAAAGVTVPAYSNTAVVFGLWNPLGSGKNAVLIRCSIGFVSTTAAPSNFVLGYQTGVGSQVATGGAITAFTAATPVNGMIGAGNASVMKFTASAATLAAGASLLMTLGSSQLTTTGATTSAPYFTSDTLFDGMVIVPPGNIVVVGGNVATTSVDDITLIWEEVLASGV